tara:strand:- start:207 stop:422 length:216 start_codon:yes stop_codon:yes gene_type:complete
MITLREQKQYLKERIEHYESLITMRPQNDLVSNFSDFIKEELFNSKRKLRNIREKEIECIYFAKNYQWFNQ